MLDVDVERVEARAGGHARDLDVAHEAHGHGRDDFVAREFFLHAVSQDVADLNGHGSLPSMESDDYICPFRRSEDGRLSESVSP